MLIPFGLLPVPEVGVAISPSAVTAVSWRTGPFGTTVTSYDLTARKIVGKPFDLRDRERGAVRMVRKIMISPDGRTLAAFTEQGLLLADLSASRVERSLREGQDLGIGDALFTPDSRAVLVRSGLPPELLLLEVASGRPLVRSPMPAQESLLAFSQDGAVLATIMRGKIALRDGGTL